jgi:hypothetical protein
MTEEPAPAAARCVPLMRQTLGTDEPRRDGRRSYLVASAAVGQGTTCRSTGQATLLLHRQPARNHHLLARKKECIYVHARAILYNVQHIHCISSLISTPH